MKILHVVPTYAPGFRYGGPVASVGGLARAQARRGDDVWVATTDQDDGVRLDAPPEEILDGVEVRRFAVRGPRRMRRAPALADWLAGAAQGFDVVHAHGVFVWTTTAALAAARRVDTPAVLAPRGMLMADVLRARGTWRKRVWLGWVERENLRSLAALHLTADLENEELPPGFAPGARRFVVPNGIALEVDSGSGAPTNAPAPIARLFADPRPFALFLGRIHHKKGLDRLFAAWRAAGQPARLAIAGPDDGAERSLRALAADLGLTDGIHWLGAVEGASKASVLARAALFVYPSRSENFGNAVLEALAAGCPVLTTPTVGAKDAVTQLCGGDVIDPTLWAPHVEHWLERGRDPAWRAALRERTHTRYGWDGIAARMDIEYHNLTRPQSRQRAANTA